MSLNLSFSTSFAHVGRIVGYAFTGAFLLAACQTTQSGDPCSYRSESQGFFGATASLATDQYERCTQQLLAQLEDLQLANIQAKRRAENLEALAAQGDDDIAAAAARLAQVNRESQEALDSLNRLRADRDTDQARLNDLMQRQQALEADKKRLSDQALRTDGSDAALLAEIAALEQEQAALLEIIAAEIAA